MFHEMKELLFHPEIFFTRMTGEKTDLLFPALIIFMGGAIGLASPNVINLFSRGGGEMRNIIVMPDTVFVSLFMPFLSWIVIAGILFVLCRLFSGTGTFGATLQNAGYGCLPLTIMPVLGIINGILIGRFTEPPGAIGADVIIGLGLLSVLFTIWSGYLWTYAMEKTHAIPHGRAMAAASIVVLLYMSPVLLNILALSSPAGYFPG
jgi:hypothetical protein